MTQTTPISKSPWTPASSPMSSPSKKAVITTLAKLKMPRAASPAKPLAAPPPTDFDGTALSKEEIKLLEGENTVAARALLKSLIKEKQDVLSPAMSIFIATCKIGLAVTYDTISKREQWALKAKEDIDKVFEHQASWNTSETAIETYQILRNSLEHIRLLIPKHASIKDIDKKLEECKKRIPQSIDDFNPLVQIADLCVSFNDYARADEYFRTALTLIAEQKENSYRLVRAEYSLKFAAGPSKESWIRVLSAQDAVFALEGLEEELCPDQSKTSGFVLRLDLLKKLLDLMPSTFDLNRSEIKEKIKACESELDTLSTPDLSPREVSKGSDRSGRFGRLFAFLLLAVLAISAVAFYRRHFTKIS